MKSPATEYTRRQYGHIARKDSAFQQTALLYQLFLDDLDRCHCHIHNNDSAARGERIHHALSILMVLRNQALAMFDDQQGQSSSTNELPARLLELYDHCLACLTAVIVDNDLAPLNTARSMIDTVKGAWDELAIQQGQGDISQG
ncbi:flagellar export chaperone FliS [Endozoicomonas sp. SCSIO W0465]|uniref:flagellar export chaperone FliS n=1 Tax=Endozoicomonas sp. SCSIO W0465 TaxID=2918516 RepID=UPI002074B196|nr:flagellar protein FliS [Endozoicomonas sp. SCSIO W0465]USE38278.1 flagellar protein FliS [Endozoicomonas sp. SCSIO W0465]